MDMPVPVLADLPILGIFGQCPEYLFTMNAIDRFLRYGLFTVGAWNGFPIHNSASQGTPDPAIWACKFTMIVCNCCLMAAILTIDESKWCLGIGTHAEERPTFRAQVQTLLFKDLMHSVAFGTSHFFLRSEQTDDYSIQPH